MATLKDIVDYYKPYYGSAIFSIIAASIFEIVDLVVPYAIGQILVENDMVWDLNPYRTVL